MTIVIVLASILATVILAWMLRRLASTLAHLPRKEALKSTILLASIGLLATTALLPDLVIMLSAIKLCSRFWRIALTLSVAAVVAFIGCSKPAEPPKPHEIQWRGPETGYTVTTPQPPDNAGKEAP